MLQVLLPGAGQGRSHGAQLAWTPHPPPDLPRPAPAKGLRGTREDLPDLRAGPCHRGFPGLRRQTEIRHLDRLVPAREMEELGGGLPATLREGEVPARRLRQLHLTTPLKRHVKLAKLIKLDCQGLKAGIRNPSCFRVPRSECPSYDGPSQAEAEGDPDGQCEDGRGLQGAGKDPGKNKK